MEQKLIIVVTVFAACFAFSFGSECCKAYTDLRGDYHAAQFCEEYCCFDLSLSTITEGLLESCCSDKGRRVPANLRDDECISWLKEHIWVPIVSSIVILIILVALCTCCCCCGCCACFRSSNPGVIVTTAPRMPSHTVMMQGQQQSANPTHMGYNQ